MQPDQAPTLSAIQGDIRVLSERVGAHLKTCDERHEHLTKDLLHLATDVATLHKFRESHLLAHARDTARTAIISALASSPMVAGLVAAILWLLGYRP